MAETRYRQFCPVAMASELLCTRWTMVLVRELVAGSTRFNALRRGVPRMSPALLAKRLRDLEAAGVVRRVPVPDEPNVSAYALTEAGRDLAGVVEAVGRWGQRWVSAELSLQNLDAALLMWDMRRNLDPEALPRRRATILFQYPERPPAERRWWLVATPGEPVDLCAVDPGFEVDLYVSTDLRTMTEIWLGLATVTAAVEDGRLHLHGARELEEAMPGWLGLSPFAGIEKRPRARAGREATGR
jgi:DNA-binding HxlR family transcriptional regulator